MSKQTNKPKAVNPLLLVLIPAIATIIVALIGLLPIYVRPNSEIPTSTITDSLYPANTLPPTSTETNIPQPTLLSTKNYPSAITTPSPSCIRWDFNDGNLDGWEVWRGIKLSPGKESLSGEITMSDLGLLHMQLNIDTSSYRFLLIRYRINADDYLAQIHWHTENNTKFMGANYIDFGIITDDDWHIAEIDLNAKPSWADSKIVQTFRLDPVKDAKTGTFEYDYIWLCE